MLDQALPQVEAALRKLPDEQLRPLLSGVNTSVPPFLVMAEMQRRRQTRDSVRGQPTPEGSVVKELTDQGGIAKFEDGGFVDEQAKRDRESLGRFGEDALYATGLGAAGFADAATLIPRGFIGAANAGIVRPLRALGAPVPYMPGLLPGDDYSSMTPGMDLVSRWRQTQLNDREGRVGTERGRATNTGNAVTVPPKPGAIPAPAIPAPADGGIGALLASLQGGGGGVGGVPLTKVGDMDFYRKLLGEAPQYQMPTDAQISAAQKQKMAELGYDFSAEQAAQDERRSGLAASAKKLPVQTMLQMGLAMMNNRGRNFLGALGEGGQKAADFYQAGKKAEMEERRAIQAGDMQIAREKNREKLAMYQLASQELNKRADVAHRNAAAVHQNNTTALGLRNQDVSQRNSDLRANAAEAAANLRSRLQMLAGMTKGSGATDKYYAPSANEYVKEQTQLLRDELTALVQRQAKNKLTPEEFARKEYLSNPKNLMQEKLRIRQEADRLYRTSGIGGMSDEINGDSY